MIFCFLFEKRCKVTHFDFMLQIKNELFMFFLKKSTNIMIL